MADIVSIHDDKPEGANPKELYNVGGYWVISTAGEPSPLEVQMFKVLSLLDTKAVVTKDEMEAKPTKALAEDHL